MFIIPPSGKSRFFFESAPPGYPKSRECVGEFHMPVMSRVGLEVIPDFLVPFNDLARASSPSTSSLHFYKKDQLLLPVLQNPVAYVESFMPFRSVLLPDFTLSPDMPTDMRVRNTVWSRQVGAIWEEHGLRSVVNVRWSCKRDWDFVFDGIPTRSVVAVSAYGSIRNLDDRNVFVQGLKELVERLEPLRVIIHGPEKQYLMDVQSTANQFVFRSPNAWKESLIRNNHLGAALDHGPWGYAD